MQQGCGLRAAQLLGMSSESDSEDSDVEFAKAVQRGSNRRGAVVQQTARRRLRTPEKDRLNPMRQTWAGGGRHASRKTDLGSISSANQLTPSQQLRAAALAGDLPWIMQLMASEVEALGIMRQCEPTVKRLRMRRVELAKTIRHERATVAEAKVEMEAGLAAVERCARPLLPPRLSLRRPRVISSAQDLPCTLAPFRGLICTHRTDEARV